MENTLSLYNAMIVPTRATARAPIAPTACLLAPLVEPEAVALAALPWKVVPVTTWPSMVVVTVETEAAEPVALAEEAIVLLQSVQVPVKAVHGAPLGAPEPNGPPGPPGPPVGWLFGPQLPVVVHVDHEHGPQPLGPPGPR